MISSIKKTVQVMFVLSVFIATGGFCLQKAEAKSVSWNATINEGFTARWGWNTDTVDRTNDTTTVGGWMNALKDPNITITYVADAYDNATGVKLTDGATIPVGTVIRITPKVFEDADISWFGTGYSSDSPNGHWIANAGAPSSPSCLSGDYVGAVTLGGASGQIEVHIPLNIAPPSLTYTATGPVTKTGTNLFQVTGNGSISVSVTYGTTYGKFYYRYFDRRSVLGSNGKYSVVNKCVGDNTPLRKEWFDAPPSPYYDSYGCYYYYTPVIDPITYEQLDAGRPYCSTSGSYQLAVPVKSIPFNFVAGATNTAPNPPTITGPTTGAPNTAYSFAFRGSDPNSDTVRYGIDWDNNSSVDAWLPASGYVASNTSQSSTRSWTTTGVKTFKAQTQDSKGATSGWSSPFAITLSNPVNTPTLNYAINGSTSSVSVPLNANLNIVWSSTNITSCTAYGAGWSSGSSVGISGNINIPATQTDDYILNCVGSNGSIARSITVNLVNTLKVCQNSCSSGIQRGNTSSTQSFTLAQGGTQNLVSCFNPSSSCNDASGNVTSSTTWGEQGGNNTAALSGTDPKTVTGTNGGSENISASYSSQTNNMTVNVACLPTVSCDNAPGRENYCQSDTFTVDNGCGVTLNCNGTKSCNYNWKEVAP